MTVLLVDNTKNVAKNYTKNEIPATTGAMLGTAVATSVTMVVVSPNKICKKEKLLKDKNESRQKTTGQTTKQTITPPQIKRMNC